MSLQSVYICLLHGDICTETYCLLSFKLWSKLIASAQRNIYIHVYVNNQVKCILNAPSAEIQDLVLESLKPMTRYIEDQIFFRQ